MRRKYPAKPGEKPRTFFTSFVKGMQQLTDRMADAAGRERIHTGAAVASLQRTSGHGWRAQLSDGSTLDGDAVIIATESWAAEPLIRPSRRGDRRRPCQHTDFFVGDGIDRLQRERSRLRSECLRGFVPPRGGPCPHGGYVLVYQVAGPGTDGQGAAARFRRWSAQPRDCQAPGRGARADGTRGVP